MNRKEQQVLSNRRKQYGDAVRGHENLGLLWTGMLQNHYQIELPHPIPSHVVLLMMAANKFNRAVCPYPLVEDNYVDGVIYLKLAREAEAKGDSSEHTR